MEELPGSLPHANLRSRDIKYCQIREYGIGSYLDCSGSYGYYGYDTNLINRVFIPDKHASKEFYTSKQICFEEVKLELSESIIEYGKEEDELESIVENPVKVSLYKNVKNLVGKICSKLVKM